MIACTRVKVLRADEAHHCALFGRGHESPEATHGSVLRLRESLPCRSLKH